MVKVEIEIPSELLNDIKSVIEYSNARKRMQNEDIRMGLEVFVISAIAKQVEEFQGLIKPLTNQSNNKGRLRNNFSNIFKEEGLGLTEISKLTNLPVSTLSTIFKNKSQPTMDKFILIWGVLNYPPISKCFYWEEEK